MLKQLSYFMVFLACICATVNSDNPQVNTTTTTPGQVNVTVSDAIAKKVLSFALKMSMELKTDSRKTLIFSPLSVMSSLAMLMIGAREQTTKEISSLFGQTEVDLLHDQFSLMLSDVEQSIRETTSNLRHLDAWHEDSTENGLISYPEFRNGTQEVRVANGLFVQQKYKMYPAHRKALSNIYNTDLLTVDFKHQRNESTHTINIWINLQTNNKVDDMIVNEFTESTKKVIVSVLAIKAAWEIDFIVGLSRVQNFYPNGTEFSDQAIPVEMMTGAGAFPYYQDTELGCQIIGIPYDGSMMTLYLIQPVESSIDRLTALQQHLKASNIEKMIKKMRRLSAIVVIPKMQLKETLKLSEPLKKLGVSGIFDEMQTYENRRAAIRGSKSTKVSYALTVSEIFHTLVFNVEEHGTEADGASLSPLFRSGYEVIFRADTPFLMLVRNDLTKLPLIYGIINEPPLANE